jgi:heptosyltransferase-2
LLGAAGDFALCEALRAGRENVVNLAGKLSLLQSAALMRDAAMSYVNDSAPLHLASAMNAPTTCIFCSTVPAFGFGPLADNACIVEPAEPLECRPCGLHGFRKCPQQHFRCAKSIDVGGKILSL